MGMIQVVDLYKTFAGHQVLKGVNLTIEPGKITTIIGGSGAGKTVLLKHLNALLLPDRGQVLVDGVDITRLRQKGLNRIRNKFGVLFQGAALLDSFNLFDNVAFPLREKTEMSETEIEKKVMERLEQVGLEQWGYKFPAEVSGGMKKRAGLARALSLDPKILFYDEPSAGLDPVTSAEIDQLMLDLTKKLGVTSVVVTHEMDSAFTIADRMCMLDKGKVILDGDLDRLAASDDPRVRQFRTGELEGPAFGTTTPQDYLKDLLL